MLSEEQKEIEVLLTLEGAGIEVVGNGMCNWHKSLYDGCRQTADFILVRLPNPSNEKSKKVAVSVCKDHVHLYLTSSFSYWKMFYEYRRDRNEK